MTKCAYFVIEEHGRRDSIDVELYDLLKNDLYRACCPGDSGCVLDASMPNRPVTANADRWGPYEYVGNGPTIEGRREGWAMFIGDLNPSLRRECFFRNFLDHANKI